MDKMLTTGDALVERMTSDLRDRAEREVEIVRRMGALALRLDAERHRFAAKGLVLAFHVGQHPRLYILRRDHSAWATVWFCYNHFRLETERKSRRGNNVSAAMRVLSSDLELAAQLVLAMVSADDLPLGTGYEDRHLMSMDELARSELFRSCRRPLRQQSNFTRTRDHIVSDAPVEVVPAQRGRAWWQRLFS